MLSIRTLCIHMPFFKCVCVGGGGAVWGSGRGGGSTSRP